MTLDQYWVERTQKQQVSLVHRVGANPMNQGAIKRARWLPTVRISVRFAPVRWNRELPPREVTRFSAGKGRYAGNVRPSFLFHAKLCTAHETGCCR